MKLVQLELSRNCQSLLLRSANGLACGSLVPRRNAALQTALLFIQPAEDGTVTILRRDRLGAAFQSKIYVTFRMKRHLLPRAQIENQTFGIKGRISQWLSQRVTFGIKGHLILGNRWRALHAIFAPTCWAATYRGDARMANAS